jgi:lysophospholipase L1-like esterase
MGSVAKNKPESLYEPVQGTRTQSNAVMKNQSKVFLLFLLKFIAAVFIALVIWELILSNAYLSKPLSQTHAVLGRIFGSGLYVQGKEGFARTRLNELGLRNAPISPKQPGKTRVLILGDSYTQATQVSDKEIFSSLLQEQLGQDYEVINSGREGASPNHYIALSEFNNKTFQPDITVIQLSEGDFAQDPFGTDQGFYFVKTPNGFALHENESFISRNVLATQFAFLQQFLNFSVMRLTMEKLEALRPYSSLSIPSVSNSDQAKFIPFIVEKLKASYGHPILVYIPKIDYFSADYNQASKTETLLAKAALDSNVDFISMRQSYIQTYKNEHRVSHGFANTQPGMGHINALGHALIAKNLTEIIRGREDAK